MHIDYPHQRSILMAQKYPLANMTYFIHNAQYQYSMSTQLPLPYIRSVYWHTFAAAQHLSIYIIESAINAYTT